MNNKIRMYKNIVLISQVGLTFVTTIFLSLYFGNKLDNMVKTNCIFKIVFVILGVIAGFLGVYKIVMKASKK